MFKPAQRFGAVSRSWVGPTETGAAAGFTESRVGRV